MGKLNETVVLLVEIWKELKAFMTQESWVSQVKSDIKLAQWTVRAIWL